MNYKTPIRNDGEMVEQQILLSGNNSIKKNLAIYQRKILINQEITNESVTEAIYYLYTLMDLDREESVEKNPKPIDILLNTPGGSVWDGLILVSLIEQMKDMGYTINTTAIGTAASMGFIIFITGSNRYSYRHAQFMLHDISTMMGGKVKDLEESMEDLRKCQKQVFDIIKKYTCVPDEKLKEWIDHKRDMFFYPDEAAELGIVDKVL